MDNGKRITRRGFRSSVCWLCKGSGVDPRSVMVTKRCPECHGEGESLREDSREEEIVSYER